MQFSTFFASLGVMLLYGLCAFGWGGLIGRFCYGRQAPGWAYTTALGLAVWIFLGGVLNDLGLGHAYALDMLAGLGLLAALGLLWVVIRNRAVKTAARVPEAAGGGLRRDAGWWLAWGFLVAAAAFLALTVMPTLVFNWGDDLHTYLTRPVRMLQTGTIGGDDFDLLGIDSLGAQSFLHALVVAHSTPAFINGADAIFCFALSGFLLIELARLLGAGWLVCSLAVLVMIAIHPQIVNVSAVYSGTLMILAVVYASLPLMRSRRSEPDAFRLRHTIPPALFTAALLALKNTFVFFAAAYWLLFFAMLLFGDGHHKRGWATAGVLLLNCAILVAPWVGLHVSHYLSVLRQWSAAGDQPGLWDASGDGIGALFSGRPLWGARLVHYDVALLLLACAFALALWLLRRTPAADLRVACVPIAALAGASVGAFLFNGALFEVETAVRYSAPILIAALPATALLLTRIPAWATSAPRGVLRTAITGGLVAVIVLFSSSVLQRARIAATGHTLVSFPVPEAHYEYMRNALGAPGRAWTRQAQMATAEGAAILAWISVPFHLDFRRNRILVVSEPGVANPWLSLPVAAEPPLLRQFLRSRGVRYVFLEYRGPGIKPDSTFIAYVNSPYPRYRQVGQVNLYFRKSLLALADESRIIQRTPGAVLYEIADSTK